MIRVARPLAVVAVAAGSLLAGCSAEPERTTEALRPLAAREQAYAIVSAGKEHRVTWTLVLANPNRWHFAENVVATLVGRDAQGREVVRSRHPVDAVPPGRTTAFSATTSTTTPPAKVEISLESPQWRKAARIPSAFKRFPVADLNTVKLRDGQYLVSGNLRNPFRKETATLTVTAVLRDRNGRTTGGRADFVEKVGPGTWRRFAITVPKVTGGVDPERTEVFVTPWGSTAGPYEELARAGAVPLHTDRPRTAPFPKERGGEAASFE
ncbi:hypothetical protein GCM10010106_18900 [Thermopolyspora flexuosa]|uniref:Lipoprotein n=1 Tax=Thermopolyspora flexuosa TaxID=103836 RepID=A0A543J3X3_9ACTN|nr:hypothetical protein FHX40_4289 [Thermopolyspora flexuosa]GGM72713.1 hypothetical protein GCM10010106_18900 [Thermopolyspora flexuosa]